MAKVWTEKPVFPLLVPVWAHCSDRVNTSLADTSVVHTLAIAPYCLPKEPDWIGIGLVFCLSAMICPFF